MPEVSLAGARDCRTPKATPSSARCTQPAVAARRGLGHYRHYMQRRSSSSQKRSPTLLEMVLNAHAVSPCLFAPRRAIFKDVDAALIVAWHQLPRRPRRRYMARGPRRHPVQRRDRSEYRYRESVPNPRALVVGISQSGRPPTPLARCITPGRSAIATAWRSATFGIGFVARHGA